jgi:hypothetical protein
MTDAQIEKVLAPGNAIAAVLLQRGGWLKAQAIRMRIAFPAEEASPAVWVIELVAEDDEPWHQVYIEAANIIGVSIRSYDASQNK